MESLKKNKLSIFLLIVFMIVIYLIGKSYMPAADEYNYSHITWTNQRLSGIRDIITSQTILYEKWTGRIPVLTTIQTILYGGTWIYELLNPIIFAIFVVFIGCIVYKNPNYFKISLAICLCLFFIGAAGEKFIWLSGSINYLWTATLMLGVMYYFYQIIMLDKKISKKEMWLLFGLSFFSGWSQENTAFVLGSFIIVIGILNIKKVLKYSKREKAVIFTSVILFGIGSMLLIFAPGNFSRLNSTQASTERFYNMFKNLLYMSPLTAIYVTTIIILAIIKQKQDNITKKTMLKSQIIFILPVIIALLPMLLINEFPVRATLPYETLIMVGILANSEYIVKNLGFKKTVIIFQIIVTIGIGYKLLKNVSVAQNYMLPYKEKIATEINIAKMQNQKDVVLSAFEHTDKIAELGKFNLLVDFSPQSSKEYLTNMYMSTYYGFDSIVAVKDSER